MQQSQGKINAYSANCTITGKDALVRRSTCTNQSAYPCQHEGLEKLNPASVNTLKIMSFLKEDGVSILSTIVRVGLEGQRVDNLTTGGYCLGVDEGGYFRETGFTKNGEPVSVLPNGYVFKGERVPGYHNATERVKRAHLKLGQFRFVSWDIAIDPDETPIMIEYNLFYQGLNLS